MRIPPPDRRAVLALLAVPLLVLGRALLPGRVLSPADIVAASKLWAEPGLVPANPLLTDVAWMFHPWLLYAAEEIRGGRFPLWNPYAFAGVPFFANPQTALLFPLNALAYVLPVPTALALIAILKLGLAGLGTYWFLRLLAVAVAPAFIAALAFALNGVLIVWLQWSFGNAVAVLPWLLALTERLRARPDGRGVAGLAAVVAVLVFAGYPQAVVVGFAASGAWVLARARRAPAAGPLVARWAVAWGLGALVSAVQWLPFLEYLRESAVLAYRREWMWNPSLPLRAAVVLLMPHYYGSPTGHDYWGPANFNEITVSVGLVPLVALPVALLAGWSRPGVRFFAGLGVLAALLLYGMPLASSALAGVPPLSMVISTRVAPLLALALCVLAGLGLQAAAAAPALARRAARRAVRMAFATLVGVACLVLIDDGADITQRRMQVSPILQYLAFLALLTAAALIVLDLLARGARTWQWVGLGLLQAISTLPLAATYNPVIDARLFYPAPPPVIRRLATEHAGDHGRVAFAQKDAANLGLIFRLPEASGYDGMTPRRIEQLADPEGSLDSLASGIFRVTVPASSPVFDLLGIRSVIGLPDAMGRLVPLDGQTSGLPVHRNPGALPRAFLVFRARACLSEAEVLPWLQAGRIDLSAEVVLAGCDAPAAGGPAGPRSGAAEITEYAAERVRVRTIADAPAYLVLADAWYPGWTVRVDGETHPLRRANHAFRAVGVPPGAHEVEFRYEPASIRWGLGMSLAGLALAAAVAWRDRGPTRG